MDLESLKYAELQKLAKELGLKANMKAEKLLKAIKEHYEQEKDQHAGLHVTQEETDALPAQEVPENDNIGTKTSSNGSFVNKRRGRATGTKRKISDVATSESGSDGLHSTPPEDTVAPAESGSAKRRRVSAKTQENNEASVAKKPERDGKALKGGKIPRLQKKSLLRPVTPNFKKLHEAQFNKMESIDSYVQRKTKQMDTYKNAVKELKMLSDETKLQIKGNVKTKPTRTSLFSPAPPSRTEEGRRHTLLSASKPKPAPKKSGEKEVVPFKPTVLSTRRINVRFTEATKDNEHKKSLIKTPARMSPCVSSSTPLKQVAKPSTVKTASSATKTPAPFVFTGNTSTSTPGTQKKNVFDLKASLARPLSYKPHMGKLTPFGESKENPAADKSMTVNSHQNSYKQPKLQTRMDRRVKQTEDRKQKKNNLLGARRGLVMM